MRKKLNFWIISECFKLSFNNTLTHLFGGLRHTHFDPLQTLKLYSIHTTQDTLLFGHKGVEFLPQTLIF